MSHNNSPHASTHASSLSPPPQYMTERRTPETQPPSSGSYDAPYYQDSPHGHPSRRATAPAYPTSYPYQDSGLQASGLVAPQFESDPYPSAARDSPYPIPGNLPSNDMYMNSAAGFNSSQIPSNYSDVPMGAVQNDYFDPSTFAAQQPSNPAVERSLIENIVQNALSAQQALDRGEQFTVKERLAEITRALRDLGLSKGVLGLDGVLPSLVDDSPTGAVNAPLSPPLLGAGSSPLMYVGSVGGVEAGIPPQSGGAKRAAELDEGPNKALKLTPPRDVDNGINSSPGHSPPLGGQPNVNGMLMHGFTLMASVPDGLNRPIVASGLSGAHPPALMHAHTFPGGMHAPHISSPLAGMSYENSMGAAPVHTMPPPDSASSTFRSEPGATPPLPVDPYNSHMYSQPPLQGHYAGYHVSRSPSMHSDESDDESDEGHRHVKQEHGTGANVPLGRSTMALRQTPPKPRGSLGGGHPGDATPDMNMSSTMAHSANILPPELKSEVDRVFFKFLNRTCSNLEATDSKGEAIHQTLMAKKMARLDELPDFRPFKFRIQAFTNGFLEELASEGYPDEVIPMKKIKSYLWNQPYISRFNEDGKKAKSKGNHIWNIDARKIDEGGSIRWTFREFKRKIAGTPPGIAYHGHHWQWAPHVWDPQLSRANITASFSSPSLPSWLSWNENVLSGTPGPDATNTDIIVHAKVLNDPDDHILSHTFHLTIAPSAVDPAFGKSRRPSLAHDVRRNVSDSAVTGGGMRARAASTSSNPSSDNHQVMQVLASAVSRVTHAAHAAQVHSGVDQAASLVKQQQVLGITAQAVADEVRAGPHPDCQGTASVLVAAAHSVVVGAAQLVATDRVTQATRSAVDPSVMAPNQTPISVTEVSVATQSAVAHAVALNGPMATEVEVMMTANALIQQQQIASTNEAFEASQATSHILGNTPSGSVSPQMGQIGDHRSRSMSSLGNQVGAIPMNVGMVSGLGPGLDGMSVISSPSMHGMPGMVSNGMQ